jgi:hypothetical protein
MNPHFSEWVYLQISHLFPHWSRDEQNQLLDQVLEGDAAQSKAGRLTIFAARQDYLRD